MKQHGAVLWIRMLVVAAITACTNGGGLGTVGGGGGGGTPPPVTGIGVAIPTGKIGVVNDPTWGSVGGYTQEHTSQVLAFPPGTKITITNLSSTTPHTLNVIGLTNTPPPNWPANPSLSFSPTGNGVLGTNYASGILNPTKSVTVKLTNPGIYLIGCAFHYVSNQMRDIIEVAAGATPGPTASPGPGPYIAKRAASAPLALRQPRLVDQRGRSFTLASLSGEPLVITFISAHCTDACPLINAQFADAARKVERANLAARLLTITLDPEHDSLKNMRELADRFDANPRYWLLAGGSITEVHKVMREFGVVSIEGRDDRHNAHTTFVYVMSPSGTLVQTMLASSGLSDSILDAVRDARQVASR
jgi:cytochrome oxidase Cu insertion factor (SCO1/SenC/PrrC family)